MFTTLDCAVALAASTIFAATAFAQSAKDIRGPSPLVAIENQPPARLIVDPPLAKQLEQGLVFIQYAAENLHIARLMYRHGSVTSTLPSTMRRGTLSMPVGKR